MLTFYRFAAIGFRPLAVILEKYAVGDYGILVIIMPISMLVLAFFSWPIHIDFYKKLPCKNNVEIRLYLSKLTQMSLLGVFFVIITSFVSSGSRSLILISLTSIFLFLSEKYADELSRYYEFNKRHQSWFKIQLIRSSWLILPSFFYFYFEIYVIPISFLSFFSFFLFFFKFHSIFGMPSNVFKSHNIIKDLFLMPGSLISASITNVTRIIISNKYQNFAHLYMALSQLFLSVSVFYNILFTINNRKKISRNGASFFIKMKKVNDPLSLFSYSMVTMIILSFYILSIFYEIKYFYIIFILSILMFFDSMIYAIQDFSNGCSMWIFKKNVLIKMYIIILMSVYLIIFIMCYFVYFIEIKIIYVSFFTSTCSFLIYKYVNCKILHKKD